MNLAGLVPLVLQGVDLSNSPADFLLGGASVTGWTLALYFLWAFVTDRIVPRQQADQWRDLYLQEAKDNEGLIHLVNDLQTPAREIQQALAELKAAVAANGARLEARQGTRRAA